MAVVDRNFSSACRLLIGPGVDSLGWLAEPLQIFRIYGATIRQVSEISASNVYSDISNHMRCAQPSIPSDQALFVLIPHELGSGLNKCIGDPDISEIRLVPCFLTAHLDRRRCCSPEKQLPLERGHVTHGAFAPHPYQR